MVRTRASKAVQQQQEQQQDAQCGHQQQQQQHPRDPQPALLRRCSIPSASEQEEQLQVDRQKIHEYRKDWQDSKGLGHTACRHMRDVLWWLSHVCGVNMLDYEEKVIVVCIFLAVLVLILLGAYKQGTQMVQLLRQLPLASRR